MRLNSKLTWGLAWTGLAVVLAVPSADYLTGSFGKGKTAAVITSTTDPVVPAASQASAPQQVATVTTKVTKTGVSIIPAAPAAAVPNGAAAPVLDPVDKYVKSGKTLPDYISDDSSGATANSTPAKTPAPAAPALATTPDEPPTQVAAIDPAPVAAPVPFPARPAILDRPSRVAPKDQTVIVDDSALAAPVDQMPTQLDVNGGPLPPAGIADDWRSIRERRLDRYLERNGLVNDGPDSSASVVVVQRPPADYDPDGFYLSDGPNNARAERRARIEEMLDDSEDGDVSWF